MSMLVNCSNCYTALRLPLGATAVRCGDCRTITSAPPALPPPYMIPSSSSSSSNDRYPAPPPPLFIPAPPSHGRKRAVLVGISYLNTDDELKGCIDDAKRVKDMLINRFNFPQSSILMLTGGFINNNGRFVSDETDSCNMPTKHNIMMAMSWLVEGCESGDSLVFYYSGHGKQIENDTGDEIDGQDETLLPLDHVARGMIIDDEINKTMVRPLPAGVKLHAIIDACRSATVLDLPFLSKISGGFKYEWENHRPRSGIWKGTCGGEAISFSGCADDQTSTATDVVSEGTFKGTMTSAFINAIEEGKGTTYWNILSSMRSTIQETFDDLLAANSNARTRPTQEPQLGSNYQFDVHSKPFSL